VQIPAKIHSGIEGIFLKVSGYTKGNNLMRWLANTIYALYSGVNCIGEFAIEHGFRFNLCFFLPDQYSLLSRRRGAPK
jgi:hypothetical protein